MVDYELLDLGIGTIHHGNFETLRLAWHLAGAREMVAELNRFGKKQGIIIFLLQMRKLRPEELIGVSVLCFALLQGLSPK